MGNFLAKTESSTGVMTDIYVPCLSDVPGVIHAKLPVTGIILGVTSSEGHIILIHFIPRSLKFYAAGYFVML